MATLPSNPKESFKKLNPHIYGAPPTSTAVTELDKVTKRLRQSSKPLLNKLETQFLAELTYTLPGVTIHAQAWRVRIANGSWFKVDFCALVDGKWRAWEVKGNKGKNIDRGKLALKVAASSFLEVQWFIVWKDENGGWNRQEVLP